MADPYDTWDREIRARRRTGMLGLAIAAVAIAAICWGITSFAAWTCQRSAGVMGLEGKFVGVAGCYVLTPSGRWVSESAVRYDLRADRLGESK